MFYFKKFNLLNKIAFKSFFSRKISRRLILTNLFLSIIPLILVTFIVVFINNKTISSYIFQRNFETAKRAANEINLFLETPRRVIISLANSPDIASMERFIQNLMITKIKADYPLFNNIYIIRDNGKLIASTSYEQEEQDFTRQPLFKEALKGKEYLSSVFFTKTQSPIMYISEPILRFNKVVAVIIGEVDIKNIWDLLDDITIGETGKAFLFSSDGTLIAHFDKTKVLQQQKIDKFSFYREIINGRSGIDRYVDDNDVSHLAAYIPVPDFSWGLVLQQTEEEAFGLANKTLWQIFGVVIITFIFSIISSLLLVKRFTTPLFHLLKGVKEISVGNLKYKIELPYKDELSILAGEFNEMAHNLGRQQIQLQKMERMSTMSRFASMVSHEIRNPLNSMGINMQMIIRLAQKDPVPLDKLQHFTSMISSEIERIDDLINNFLVIARPPRLNLLTIELHSLLSNIINVHKENAKIKKIRIKQNFSPKEIYGNFDENQLKQVIGNLITNSFDAMPHGGEINIYTHLFVRNVNEQQTRFCQIEFRDIGSGILEKYMNEIFNIYFTTKKTGTGLGLAIAKQIIESHNGQIYIHSEKDVGTSVYIELPVSFQKNEVKEKNEGKNINS